MKIKRIFIVEAENRGLILNAFQQIKCPNQLHFFANGSSLLEDISIGHQLPDLILLEHQPPHIDGIQVLKTLKEHPVWKIIPVVMWCSYDIQAITEFYQLGANSYIEKSVEWDFLLVQVEVLCSYWFDTVYLPRTSLFGTV